MIMGVEKSFLDILKRIIFCTSLIVKNYESQRIRRVQGYFIHEEYIQLYIDYKIPTIEQAILISQTRI